MKSKGIILAYIFAVINAGIVGLSFLFTKTAIMSSSPLDTLAFRFTIAFAAITLLGILKLVRIDFSIKRFKKLTPLVLFYPTLFFSFQAYGLEYSQSSDGGIIFATTPILTAILASFFLKEKTTLLQKLSILLSVFGVIFIFIMKGSSIELKNLFGISLLLLSCLSIAGYSVMARSLAKEFKPLEITFFMLGVGFIFFNSAAILSHLQNGDIEEFLIPWSSFQFIVSIVFLGILASLITSLLSNYILAKIKASQMSVFSNLSTIVSISAGALFLGERISIFDIIGSILIILGVIGTNYFGWKKDSIKYELRKKVLFSNK